MHRNVYLTDAYTLEEVNRLIENEQEHIDLQIRMMSRYEVGTHEYECHEGHLRIARGKMSLLTEAKEKKEIDLCYKELEEYNSDNAKARRAGYEDYEDMIYNRGKY